VSDNFGETFAIDNFTFEFIPEPSSLLLTILGAVTLFAVVRRKTPRSSTSDVG
jgi:hypothetical protein